MSHFGVLVLVHPKAEDVEAEVGALLEPFDENKQVPSHDIRCHCVGDAADDEVREAIVKEFGDFQTIRATFHEKLKAMTPAPSDEVTQQMWRAVIDPMQAKEKQLKAEHPLRDTPKADCEECEGTGTRQTRYNPKSKWDWFVIGGRWTGCLTNYDPRLDPNNQETCSICHGTGKRNDELGREARKENPAYTCNGCDGKGVRTKWPTEWGRFDGDIMPVSSIKKEDLAKIFNAIVTPDSQWHQQGEMGWFGTCKEELTDIEWMDHLDMLVKKYSDHVAVVVDCHI